MVRYIAVLCVQVESRDVLLVCPDRSITYPSAEFVKEVVTKAAERAVGADLLVVLDGSAIHNLDSTSVKVNTREELFNVGVQALTAIYVIFLSEFYVWKYYTDVKFIYSQIYTPVYNFTVKETNVLLYPLLYYTHFTNVSIVKYYSLNLYSIN